MCFSAPASFAAAAATGAAGVYALAHARSARELPVAAIPILFAVQQLIEGMLWLDLERGSQACAAQTQGYLAFAYILWPIYAPIAARLVEPEKHRRELMEFCAILGALTAVAASAWIFHASSPSQLSAHLGYSGDPMQTTLFKATYVLSIVLALSASSHAKLRQLSALVIVGFVVSYAFYWEAFTSVWCFFAAAASVIIAWHLKVSVADAGRLRPHMEIPR